jgi:hypothetical protein
MQKLETMMDVPSPVESGVITDRVLTIEKTI